MKYTSRSANLTLFTQTMGVLSSNHKSLFIQQRLAKFQQIASAVSQMLGHGEVRYYKGLEFRMKQ
jgi:hypothetical protein